MSSAVRYFHIGSVDESYLDYLELHEKFPNIQVQLTGLQQQCMVMQLSNDAAESDE